MGPIQLVDLGRREADIAIRFQRPKEPNLVVRRLTESCSALYASREYVSRFGKLKDATNLHGHRLIGFSPEFSFVPACGSTVRSRYWHHGMLSWGQRSCPGASLGSTRAQGAVMAGGAQGFTPCGTYTCGDGFPDQAGRNQPKSIAGNLAGLTAESSNIKQDGENHIDFGCSWASDVKHFLYPEE